MHELEPNPPHIRAITDAEAQRLRDRGEDVPDSLEDCYTCKGKKKFLWYDGSGDVVEFACNCGEQYFLYLWLLNAGIGLGYQRLRWLDFDPDVVKSAPVQKTLEYFERVDLNAQAGLGLLLRGQIGTGKTMLATLALKKLVSLGRRGYFVTFDYLLQYFTDGWRSDEDKSWFERHITKSPFLIVDDMGREGATARVSVPTFDRVLRNRVAAQRPTIITTNKSMEDLAVLYSANAMSLISSYSEPIDFWAEDYRPIHRNRMMAENELGLRRPVVLG